MSRLDHDLARAIDETDEDQSPAITRGLSRGPSDGPGPKSRSVGLLIALTLIAAAVLALVMLSFKDAAVYAKSVDQLLASRTELEGRRVRVEGTLVHGSLLKRDTPCEYRFKMHKNGAVLDVRYPQCVVPDTFRDRPEADVAVTAEGKLTSAGVFEASQIMAKCPSKYEEQNGKRIPVGMQGASM